MSETETATTIIALLIPFLLILFMGGIILALFAFWIWMLVDCIKYESNEGNNRLIWVLVIIFAQILGAIIYYFVQRKERLQRSLITQQD